MENNDIKVIVKIDIIYVISHNYMKIKVYSHNSLPLEKILTFIML